MLVPIPNYLSWARLNGMGPLIFVYGSYNSNTQHIGMKNFLKIFENFFWLKKFQKRLKMMAY
jgi:hypothetical protein